MILIRMDRPTDRCVMLHHSDVKEEKVILKLFQVLKHHSYESCTCILS